LKNQNKKLFILFLLSFFSTILITNNKLYVLLFVIFASILFFYFKRPIFETIFLTFVLSLPFENTIREWTYQITPRLFDNVTTSGYILYFGITIKLILAITVFLFLLLNKKTVNKQIKILTPEIIFILFFLTIACINTFFNKSTIGPIFGLIKIWISVLTFIISRIFFTENKKIFFVFITSLYLFCISIGTLQLIKQKPLGRYIELTPSFNQEFGYSTTDGDKQYRVSGFISHPVYFASFLSILLPIYLGIVLNQFQEKSNTTKIIIIVSLIIGCFVILGTLSRSAFFTLLLSLFLMKNLIFKKIIKPADTGSRQLLVLLPKVYSLYYFFAVISFAASIRQDAVSFRPQSFVFQRLCMDTAPFVRNLSNHFRRYPHHQRMGRNNLPFPHQRSGSHYASTANHRTR